MLRQEFYGCWITKTVYSFTDGGVTVVVANWVAEFETLTPETEIFFFSASKKGEFPTNCKD